MSTFYKSNSFSLFLLILCCIPSIFSLFHAGFFISDDGEWMIIRLSAFYETLKTGQIPVRFIERLNNGYGYPLANYMYPGYLYVGSFLHLIGFGFVTTIKIIFGASMIASSVCTYFWLQKLFTKIPAFVGALLYVYMPYHLFDLYVRGSIGEVLVLAMVPFILWQIERKDSVLIAIGIAMLIISHNTLALLFMMPLVLYAILRSEQKEVIRRFYSALFPFLLGLFLAGFFWIPALYDLQYTIFRSVIISDWQNYFASIQLIGYSTLLVIIWGFFFLFIKQKTIYPYKNECCLFLVLGIFSLYISLPISFSFWQIIPSSFIQFPFRALSLLIPSIAFVSAWILSIIPRKMQLLVGGVFFICAIASCIPFFSPQEFIDKGDMYYISNFSTTTVKDEYMPKWVKKKLPGMAEEKIEITRGEGKIIQKKQIFHTIMADISLKKESTIQVNTIYFPGWKVFIDSQDQKITYNNPYGLIEFTLPAGDYKMTARFTETPVRFMANCLSLITGIFLLFLFIKQVRYNKTIK